MNHDRLCSWLGLPTGSWPPDHYALLSLSRGTGDLADIEARVLERMERIRPHQLLHPELVTEGMNRLAQALVCLTDPVARAAYDRQLGIPPPPFELVEDADSPSPAGQGEQPAEVPFAPGLRPPGEPQRPVYEVVWEPEPGTRPPPIAPYEVVDEPKAGQRRAYEIEPDETPVEKPPSAEPAEAEPPEPPPPAPISRRAVYRQLAAIRSALRAWEGLRPVFGAPTEALATPVAVLLFLQALTAARSALPRIKRIIRGPAAPGGSVAALVRLPHAIHAVRTLLPSQRQAIALDWQRGFEALRREHLRLRGLALAARHRRPGALGRRLLRAIRRTPEWILLTLILAAILLAVLRRNP